MRKSLFLYLFVLAVVFNVFTYMYYSKQLAFDENHFKTTSTKLKDSLKTVTATLEDANYFALETNENAQNYFSDDATGEFLDHQKLIPFVKEKLLDFNNAPNGNPYVGYEKLDGKKFIINKVKVLNHRWIIVDFNNGQNWGEAIIKYFINDDKTVSFENAESVLYAK